MRKIHWLLHLLKLGQAFIYYIKIIGARVNKRHSCVSLQPLDNETHFAFYMKNHVDNGCLFCYWYIRCNENAVVNTFIAYVSNKCNFFLHSGTKDVINEYFENKKILKYVKSDYKQYNMSGLLSALS